MLRTSAPRRRRGLTLLVLTALIGAILALVPATAANAMCRSGALARGGCGIPLVIDFPAVADVRVDGGPVALLATVEAPPTRAARYPVPPTTIIYSSNSPAVCTISDATAVLVAPGTCSVTANAPGDDGYYLDADPVTETFEVLPLPVVEDPAVLTLKVPAGTPVSAGTAKVRATSTGTGPIAVRSLSAQVCRVAQAGAVRLVGAGTCRLRATQADADAVTASFKVWGFPTVPATARATEVLDVLGKGEAGYRVIASPAGVCREADGAVALIDAGTCRIEVRTGGDVVRTDNVKVTVPVKPAATQRSMDIGATVYFAFDSAHLSNAGKAALRKVAPMLAKADLVVVYGHTFGPGKNSRASRALAARRASVTVAYLDGLGVKSKAVSEVAMAMQQPVSSTAWKNRRAEVYYR